jgi:pseudomonalisin
MHRRTSVSLLLYAMLFIFGAGQAAAASPRFIDDNDTVVLKGNTHYLARTQGNAGLSPTSLPMENMIMSLKIPAAKEAELQDYLKDLHDPSSPRYHQWLTPEEYGAKFGPSAEDVAAASGWLASHGFKVEGVGKSRTWINFSGDVGKVEQTFKTTMKTVKKGDKVYQANASDPSIPRGLSDLVSGIVTLHNIPRQPKHSGARLFPADTVPNYTYGSSHYLAPGDFATIYNVKSLYSAGFDGTGQSIAIVGRTHPPISNWTTFRSQMGLPPNPPQVIVNGTDPGSLGGNEDTEADLDVEWAGAVAKNATIKFVTSKSTYSTDGVDLSAQYIVNNNVAPIMSVSFGSCEADMGSAENAFYNNLWAQAAAQGITVMVSSGDSGAAGCSAGGDVTGSGAAVNGLASTPYNVAVGGTQFSEGSGTYWNSVSSSDLSSALGYIPEVAWNESGAVAGGSGLWATGGGVSRIYANPPWQVAPGVPQNGRRNLPDVSLNAASHDAYLIYTGGYLAAVGGTSAASPSFAGLMALVLQKNGQRVGNANPQLYQLANAQYASGGATVFHDVTGSSNTVPGVTGYNSGAAYDLATGLGSVNAYSMVNSWGTSTLIKPDFTLAAILSATITQGQIGSVPVQVSLSGGFNSAVSFSVTGLPAGVTATMYPTSLPAPGSGSATLTLSVPAATVTGTSAITVTATGGSVSHSQSFSLTVAPAPAADLSVSAGTAPVIYRGSNGAVKVSTAAVNGFNAAVSFAVTGLPAGVTGSFSPASIAAPGTGSTTLTLTAAASATVGSATVTVTASGGGISRSVQTPITVQSNVVYSSSFTDSWLTAQVYGNTGKWGIVSSGSYPSAAPHSGTTMAEFYSNTTTNGYQTRIYSGGMAIPAGVKGATVSFWMFHDTGRYTYKDRIQPQIFAGTSWANIGSPVYRYNGSSGWSKVSLDVTAYRGQSVRIGFVGISGAGNNMYLDDVLLTVR